MALTESQLEAIQRAADNLGIDPADLATIISYETMGTFSPSIMGGKGGNYMGLIQFGKPERKKYGVSRGQSFEEQMESVESYLRDRGLKPGMGINDLYSTVNAGSPGRYNASDRPGEDVLSHVKKMMSSQHRSMAEGMFGDDSYYGDLNDTSEPMSQTMTMESHPDPSSNYLVQLMKQLKDKEEPKGLLGLGGEDIGILAKVGLTPQKLGLGGDSTKLLQAGVQTMLPEPPQQPGQPPQPGLSSPQPPEQGGIVEMLKKLLGFGF